MNKNKTYKESCRYKNYSFLFSVVALSVAMGLPNSGNAADVKSSYTGWDSDALFLWKGPKQTRFEDGDRLKSKFMFNIGIVEDKTEEGEINNDFFEIKNVRFNMFGKLSDRTYARVILGYDPLLNRFGTAYKDNGIGSGPDIARQSETNLVSAWLQHNISSAFRVRAGQGIIPYGLDTTTQSGALGWTSRTDWASQISTRTKILRDIGIFALGQIDKVNYSVAVVQGAGISRRDVGGGGGGESRLAKDNNDKKDLVGRVTYNPIKGLGFGASVYRGYQGDSDTSSYLSTGGITDEKHWGLDVQYRKGPLMLTAEYNKSDIDQMIVPRTDGTLIRSGSGEIKDLTLSALYKVNGWFEPKLRLERFDTTSTAPTAGDPDRIKGFAAPHDTYTIGANIYLPSYKGIRNMLLIDYMMIEEHNQASEEDNDRLELYWKVVF